MGGHHHHDHGGKGRTGAAASGSGIRAAFFITTVFAVIEIIGGLLTGSISLLSDALHMVSDVTALGLSFLTSKVAVLRPDSKRTFGYRRAEVVAALINALLLWGVAGYMLREVFFRFKNPAPVLSGPMLIIAFLGLLANIASAWCLHSEKEHSMNARGAFLHVLSDLAGSVGVIAAGAVIHFTGYYRADTIVSLFIVALILYGSSRLMAETLHILMEGAPPCLDMRELEAGLLSVKGVSGVHELHVWSLSSGFNALSAHLLVKDPALASQALKSAVLLVSERFGIRHSAFQVENEITRNSSCDICEDNCKA